MKSHLRQNLLLNLVAIAVILWVGLCLQVSYAAIFNAIMISGIMIVVLGDYRSRRRHRWSRLKLDSFGVRPSSRRPSKLATASSPAGR